MQPFSMLHHRITGTHSIYREGYQMIKFCKKCQCDTDKYASGGCKPCAINRATQYRKDHPGTSETKIKLAAWRQANKPRRREWSAINRARIRANDLAWRESKGPSYKIAARERTAEWRKDNIEQYRITNKQYAKKNKERIASYQVEYYAKNVEIKKRNAREWLKNNRVKSNKTKAQYNAKHPEQNRISRHNRRAKIRKTGGKLSKGLATKLIQLQQGKCACCALPLGDNFHLDHIMPIKLGGQNIDSNIQLLRSTCNQQKHAKHPVDFMRERGFLL